MKSKFHILILISLYFTNHCLVSQNIDSLKLALKKAKHDTTKCSLLNALIELEGDETIWSKYNEELKQIADANLKKNSPNSVLGKFYLKKQAEVFNNIGYLKHNQGDIKAAIENYRRSLNIQEKINDKVGLAASLNNLGNVYQNQGESDTALVYFIKAIRVTESSKDNRGMAYSYDNIGNVYLYKGLINKALEYFFKSLKLQEKVGDKFGLSNVLNNIGIVYEKQGDQIKALEYYCKGLKINESINNKLGVANSLNNIGVTYQKYGDLKNAIDFENRSLRIYEELANVGGVANTSGNLGLAYSMKGNLETALQFYLKALANHEELNNKAGIASTLNYIAGLYLLKKDTKLALKYSQKSLEYSNVLGYPQDIGNAANLLSQIFKLNGNYQKAFQYYELYISMRDSINNQETKKASIKSQLKYDYEKQATADSVKHSELQKVKDAQLLAQSASLKQEKTQRFSLYAGLVLALIFAGFMFNRFKVTQKQKQIIEVKEKQTQQQNEIISLQKHIVEEKNKEITDSINYAERIQRTFLATKELLDDNLKDYFVYFKPKDIVSGDFYWAETLGNGNFALVTADSTGHGVPGAIMSLLNISSLEKATIIHTNPAGIINYTRKVIIQRLKHDGSNDGGKDGMDCSIIVFDKKNNKLLIAAANNPVWIIRNTELIEIKPDKMPVGKHDKDQENFTLHTFDIQKNDVIYTLTDGFPDQFGGEKGKKFMSKNLKELLIANSHLPMDKQKILLESTFENWRNGIEQVDDVTLIGIRV